MSSIGAPATVFCNRPRRAAQAAATELEGIPFYAWATISTIPYASIYPWWSLAVHAVHADGVSFRADPAMVITKKGLLGGLEATIPSGQVIGGVSIARNMRCSAAAGVDPLMLVAVFIEWQAYQDANATRGA